MKFCNIGSALIFISIQVLFYNSLYSQNLYSENYQFISPIPGSSLHLPETSIIIRQGDSIDRSTLANNKLEVTGSRSGIHQGDLILSSDTKTLIFKPYNPFIFGEEVIVKLGNGVLTYSGVELLPVEFTFIITERVISGYNKKLCDELFLSNSNKSGDTKTYKHYNSVNIKPELPLNFPDITISISNNPSPGYIFLSPHSWSRQTAYLMIIDNDGIPIYYQRNSSTNFDFKKQYNGLLTYWDQISKKFFEMDSSYSIVDSFSCGNGYQTDLHELLVFPNGHSFIMSYDPQIVRMDTIVQGGDSAAYVFGLVVQELDELKNVIFQWRSWDHFAITDATDDIDLTQHSIDYVHGNAIEVDYDGNLLISCRNMDEITKIDRQTGDIIWRLGGLEAKNNQFQFINDPITFSHQHDVRRLPNGNITLFDNGNLHAPPITRSLEYRIDEENRIAELEWKYNLEPPTYARTRGSTRRLANNNTIIGWGHHFDSREVSEITPDGTTALEVIFPDSLVNYRAFKFPWRTNLLTADSYIIDFEYVPIDTIDTKEIVITNNSNKELQLTSYYSRSSMFSVVDNFPITLQPYQNKILQIQFSPDSIGIFSDDIHLRMQKENEMIAQVINILGSSDPADSIENENEIPSKFSLSQNFPNPFNLSTKIKYSVPQSSNVIIKVFDILGAEVITLLNEKKEPGVYDVELNAQSLSSGMYIYRIIAGSFVETKKMVLMK